jgi:NCS1 family nucleobase:cation symporter-1|tara:strand:- start:21 stop:869 length:849 start_codon:yes stop_codon:yes gene_type:complete
MIVAENYNELSKSIKIVLNVENVVSKSNILPLLTVIGTMFAYLSMVILNFGDFSRYVKNESELKKGNLSLILNLLLFSIFSVLLVLGSDIILVKNMIAAEQLLTNPTDIIGKFDNTFLTVFALIFIFFASLSTNLIANYIPSQNVLINFLPNSFSLKSAGIFIVITSFFISMFWLPVLSQIGILSFVDTVGAFFGPIFGIIIADFYLIQKKTINNKDIFSSISSSSYYYTNGWHLKALSALLVGFIFSASTIWNSNLIFLQPYSWMIGAFVSWLSYYLLVSK